MVQPDRRNNIPIHNERFSDQSIEEIEQPRYKTKSTSDYKKRKELRPTLHNDAHDGRTLNEKQQYKRYDRETKEKELNMREAIKLTLNWYQKHYQFSGKANEYWSRHLCQFEILCEEYKTGDSTRINHFAHYLKLWSCAYQFYQKLRKAEKTWKEMTEAFDFKCRSKMRRSRAARSSNNLKFKNFRKDYKT